MCRRADNSPRGPHLMRPNIPCRRHHPCSNVQQQWKRHIYCHRIAVASPGQAYQNITAFEDGQPSIAPHHRHNHVQRGIHRILADQ